MSWLEFLCPVFFWLGIIDWFFAAYTWYRPERVEVFENRFSEIYMDDDWLPQVLDALKDDFLRVNNELGPFVQKRYHQSNERIRTLLSDFFDLNSRVKLIAFYSVAAFWNLVLLTGLVAFWQGWISFWWPILIIAVLVLSAVYSARLTLDDGSYLFLTPAEALRQFAAFWFVFSGWTPLIPILIALILAISLYFISGILAAYLLLLLAFFSIIPAAMVLMVVLLIARELHLVVRRRDQGVISAALFFTGGIGLIIGGLCELLHV